MDISEFTTELVKKDAIYYAKEMVPISYPESGNQDFFQIEDDSYWFKHRNNCIVSLVKKFCPNDIFFDIGGGNGFVSKGLENNGISSVLIEPGSSGCLNARERGLKNIVCATLQGANFRHNSISAIGLFDVIEHIEDDHSFLDMIGNYLKTDGHVFITVPAYNTIWSEEDIDAGHYRRYTTKSVEEKLVSHGFEVLYSSYLFSMLPLPIFLLRTLRWKFKIRRKESKINTHRDQHKLGDNFVGRIVENLLEYEVKKVAALNKIPIGSSCIVVARKK